MPYFLSAGARLMFHVSWENVRKTRQPGVKLGRCVCAGGRKTLKTCWVVHGILESCLKSGLKALWGWTFGDILLATFECVLNGQPQDPFRQFEESGQWINRSWISYRRSLYSIFIWASTRVIKRTVTVLHNCKIVAVGSELCLFLSMNCAFFCHAKLVYLSTLSSVTYFCCIVFATFLRNVAFCWKLELWL